MASIIKKIQDHLEAYRDQKQMSIQHLSADEVSSIKGCSQRSLRAPEEDYKRSWAKLAKAQRLNRLMLYHQKLTTDYNLDSKNQHQLKTLFYDGITSDVMDRDHVIYDSNDGVIIRIDGLKRDGDGMFYFDRTTQTMNIPIQTITKFQPVSISKLSIAHKKPRPVIVLKRKND